MPPEEGVIESQAAPNVADWRTHLTDDLKSDPVVSGWAEKASEKDVPSLIKGYAHATKRLGSAINLPGKDAKPEDVAALRSKLYEAGVFQAPPTKAEEYNLKFPKELEGVGFSEDLSKKFAATLHKHGISQEAVNDLLPLYLEGMGGTAARLKTDTDKALAELKAEHGEKYEERRELVRRMVGGIFKSQEELDFFEEMGIADHPAFLSVMMRLAPLASQDSSFMESVGHKGGEITGQAALDELSKMMSDKEHPDHKGYWAGDARVQEKVRELYKKAYGTAPADLGAGVQA